MRVHKTGDDFPSAPATAAAGAAGGEAGTGRESVVARSARREVRNPIVALPSMAKVARLSPEARAALVDVLADIAREADGRAEHAWRTRKAPLAAYWRACSVYAGHIKRAVKNPLAFFTVEASGR